jgi:hypothetical protein
MTASLWLPAQCARSHHHLQLAPMTRARGFDNAPSRETSAVHGTAHMHATVPTVVSKKPSRRTILDLVPHPVAVAHDEGNTHTMVTQRSSATVIKPPNRLNLSATMSTSISPVPSDYCSALVHCHAAMQEEFQALIDNRIWKLVPRPPGANIISGK